MPTSRARRGEIVVAVVAERAGVTHVVFVLPVDRDAVDRAGAVRVPAPEVRADRVVRAAIVIVGRPDLDPEVQEERGLHRSRVVVANDRRARGVAGKVNLKVRGAAVGQGLDAIVVRSRLRYRCPNSMSAFIPMKRVSIPWLAKSRCRGGHIRSSRSRR